MVNQGEIYYNWAMNLFEQKKYEQSVINFINAFEMGYKKEEIVGFLYTCFINPNEEEFEKSYKENCVEMTRFPYNELSLDFIPVSDEKFYIFDKEGQEFKGAFEIEKESIKGRNIEFHSVLYTGIWDIREIVPNLKTKNWDTVYILLEGVERRFLSFLKLPQFKAKYLNNVLLFENCEYMRLFFEEFEEFYIPKELVSSEPEKFLDLIHQLHSKRIHQLYKERENIFLSICIPSYNRGDIALENVLHILQCPYDSEIEIVVSNNGSVQEVDGYKKIEKLSDSRLTYHKFSQNQGYATNVLKTLALAKGRFAVLCSDEDLVKLDNLAEYLSYLKANRTVGVFWEKVIGPNTYWTEENQIYEFGFDAIQKALSLNYITGITYNTKLLKDSHAFEIVEDIRGNDFLEAYVHMILAAILGKYGNLFFINLLLWDGRERKRLCSEGSEIKSYMFPENRITQLESLMEFLHTKIGMEGKDFQRMFLEQSQKIYGMLMLAFTSFSDYKEIYTWEEACFYIYWKEREYLENFPIKLDKKERELLAENLKKIFLRYIGLEEIYTYMTSEEIRNNKIISQLIQIELEGYGEELMREKIGDDLHINLAFSVESIWGNGINITKKKNMEKASEEGHLIQYLFEECWKHKQNDKKDIRPWDA